VKEKGRCNERRGGGCGEENVADAIAKRPIIESDRAVRESQHWRSDICLKVGIFQMLFEHIGQARDVSENAMFCGDMFCDYYVSPWRGPRD
jgi:hypothetical protein